MYVRAALGLIPRPRPDRLPGSTLTKVARVEEAHLAAYQRVCGNLRSEKLPLAYPHILAFDLQMKLMTQSDFPFPVVGLVHIANRLEQSRQLTATDELRLTVEAASLTSAEKSPHK